MVQQLFLHKIKHIVIFLKLQNLKIYVINFLVRKIGDFRKEINLVLIN